MSGDLFGGPGEGVMKHGPDGQLEVWTGTPGHTEFTARSGVKLVIDKAVRVCTYCKQAKDLEDFGYRTMADGTVRLQSRCNTCPR